MATTTDIVTSLFPYPGLRPFRRDEAEIFFGREEQVDQLLGTLAAQPFLAVVGPSGCGKSSLVRAGMLAALESGFIAAAGSRWLVAEMRPGNRPRHNLAEALLACGLFSPDVAEQTNAAALIAATLRRGPRGIVELLHETKLPEQTNLLVLVDQFEEIFRFRQHHDSGEARAFVDLLLASAAQKEVPIYVVITMRSDFLGDCAVFEGLPEALNQGQFLTPRLKRDDCREAILGPAAVFDAEVEPALVNRILNDIGTDPDQLPLMQHALLRVWTRSSAQSDGPGGHEGDGEAANEQADSTGFELHAPVVMRLVDYEEVGGVANALSNHADEVFDSLDERDQQIAERLFRCLSERGEGRRDTRHPTPLKTVADVAGTSPQALMEVIDAFRQPECSFLTPPDGVPLEERTVLDISHESLIRQWRRLAQWVDQESESAAMYRRLRETALLWKVGKAAFWGTPDLEQMLAWRDRERPTAAWAERYGGRFDRSMLFLDASEAIRAKRDHEEQLRQQHELDLSHRVANSERRRANEAEWRQWEQAQANKRLKFRAVVLTIVTVFAGCLGAFSVALVVFLLILCLGANGLVEESKQQRDIAIETLEMLIVGNEGFDDPETQQLRKQLIDRLGKQTLVARLGTLSANMDTDWNFTAPEKFREAASRARIGDIFLALGESKKAWEQFDKSRILWDELAISMNSDQDAQLNRVVIYRRMGDAKLQTDDIRSARNFYRQAIGFRENSANFDDSNALVKREVALLYNQMAWLLATSAVKEIRNGNDAVKYATMSCELTEWNEPMRIDTLAAAYAEAGDFDNAIKWQSKAVESPKAFTAEEFEEVKLRLNLFKAQQPYHQGPATSAPPEPAVAPTAP
jgi:tetratricopeptide (TPR) repeat protein/energy-coupling factor transporter ATP-binding protein EcfA2